MVDARRRLHPVSSTARLDVEVLLANVLQCARHELWIRTDKVLSQDDAWRLNDYLDRRQAGEPIAYIVGYKAFWSLSLVVNQDVLIPRPETEMLVEWVLEHLPQDPLHRIADLGAGSGAIALAIAQERPHWRIDATDISMPALRVARQNAIRLDIENVAFYWGDWCSALPKTQYDVIIANPPYVSPEDTCLDDLQYEPRHALVAQAHGLHAIACIIQQAADYLSAGGYLLLEHGSNQWSMIQLLFHQYGRHFQNLQSYTDLAGLPRMVAAQSQC